MTVFNEAFTNAVLADAAYVGNLNLADTREKLVTALSSRMTPTLADYIGKNFTVVTQIESGSSGNNTIYAGDGTAFVDGGDENDAILGRGKGDRPFAINSVAVQVYTAGSRGRSDAITRCMNRRQVISRQAARPHEVEPSSYRNNSDQSKNHLHRNGAWQLEWLHRIRASVQAA
jgi:hypothetical protein